MRFSKFLAFTGSTILLALPLSKVEAWYLPPCLPTDVYVEEPRGKAHCLERRETKRKNTLDARKGVPVTDRVFSPEEKNLQENVRRIYRNPATVRALRSFGLNDHLDPKLRRHAVNFVSLEDPSLPSPDRQDLSARALQSHRTKRQMEKAKSSLH